MSRSFLSDGPCGKNDKIWAIWGTPSNLHKAAHDMQHMKLVMQAVSLLLAMIGVPVDINKTPFVSEEDIFCQNVFCLVLSCFL